MRIIVIALFVCGRAFADPSPQPIVDDSLRREMGVLRAKQLELERRLEASEARARTNDPRDTRDFAFHLGREGFSFGTLDRKTEVHIRALVQVDGRAYFDDQSPLFTDTFLLRRMRPYVEGTLFGIVDFRIMPDFGLGNATVQDGYLELRPWSFLRLRAGKFKTPLGLEFLQSDTVLPLVERSLASNLITQRDVGAMLFGDVGGGALIYQIAVVNGGAEGTNGPDLDTATSKDYFFRLFTHPLRPLKVSWLAKLGLGAAASYGRATGNATLTGLPTYKSPGQQSFFSYLNAADTLVVADGERWRLTPQLYWYLGPVGVLAEYVYSSQDLQRAGMTATLVNQAWNVTASFVMTLEHAGFEGIVPKRPIDFRHRNFGAWELALRYSELRVDEKAFPLFADPAKSARRARNFGVGLNWHLTEQFKLMLSFDRTDFVGGAPNGADREPENALLGRLQVAI